MVVAVKKEDGIVVGISGRDGLGDMTTRDYTLEENIPFWKVKGVKDCYVFADSSNFAVELLRYNDAIFKGISDGKSIVGNVVPKMKALWSEYGQVMDNKEWDGQLLIVKDGKAFVVGRYFTVSEVDDVAAFWQTNYLLGGLEEKRELPETERILFAVRNLCAMKSKHLFPMMVFDSKTKKKKWYFE